MNIIPNWHHQTSEWRRSRILIRAQWLYREEKGEAWSARIPREVEQHYLSRAERELVWEGSIRNLLPEEAPQIQADIELMIDAGRLIGDVLDPDKIANRVHQHHQGADLAKLRDMVLASLGQTKVDSSYSPPWGN